MFNFNFCVHHQSGTEATTTTKMISTTPTIPEWFRNRSVLITGSTGFMGKVLVYKLLTSCPDIKKIYLLVREKKGIEPRARLQSIIQVRPLSLYLEWRFTERHTVLLNECFIEAGRKK